MRSSKLPDWVMNLTKLEEQSLGRNAITEIPEAIGDLTNLRVLSVGSNQIEHIPKSIGRLQNLTELGMFSNPLKELPNELLDLPDDCRIELRGNDLPRERTRARRVADLRTLWAEDGE